MNVKNVLRKSALFYVDILGLPPDWDDSLLFSEESVGMWTSHIIVCSKLPKKLEACGY